MGIENHRVGAPEARQTLLAALGEGKEAAVRCVDVQPESVPLGDVGQIVQRVDGPGVGGACIAVDQERSKAATAIRLEVWLVSRTAYSAFSAAST